MDEQREWPIYALANYDNGGRLLDLCHLHLRQAVHAPTINARRRHERHPHQRHEQAANEPADGLCTTTSGYQSTEEAGTASTLGNRPHPPAVDQLEWRHLIEVPPPADNEKSAADLLERRYQVQVGELAAKVRKLLSPFVSKERHINNAHQAPPKELAADTLLVGSLANGATSKQLEANQEARLRRLSWMKQHQQLDRYTQAGSEESGVRARTPERSHKRHLAKSFSVNRSNTVADNTADQSASCARRIELWLAHIKRINPIALDASQTHDSRGRYGESIVHVLLIEHSNAHLILLLIILHIWPSLLFDVFESHKFRHLNCLHLTISNGNIDLLAYLITFAQKHNAKRAQHLIEQRVSGSLFRPPPLADLNQSSTSTTTEAPAWSSKCRSKLNKVSTGSGSGGKLFWCDQMTHWPTADGARHLILLDRLKLKASTDVGGGGDDAFSSGSLTSAIYFGQTPLAWSLSFRSRRMFELLLELGGANVNSTDSAGNNGLHQVVINNQVKWTRALDKQHMSLEARNSLGFTPFLLACHLGRCELFVELLELSAVEFWCYSSVRCCGYPLASLDSILVPPPVAPPPARRASCVGAHHQVEQQKLEQKSAVSVILESRCSTNEEKSALLSTDVVKKLLEEKWKCFARRLFYTDLCVQLLQLVLMFAASLLRPARIQLTSIGQQQQQQRQINKQAAILVAESEWLRKLPELTRELWSSSRRRQTLLRQVCELGTLSIAVVRLWSFFAEWLRHKNLILQLTYNPLAANQALANTLLIACLPLRVAHFSLATWKLADASTLLLLDQLEDVLLIVASPLLWSSLLFFVAAFYVTGPFVAMINYMLMRDLRQFSLIYLIFLYAFAQSIFYINRKPSATSTALRNDSLLVRHNASSPLISGTNLTTPESELEAIISWLWKLAISYLDLLLELFKMTLSVYDIQPFRHSVLSRVSLTLFMHLIPILFNMLLAMMNNTYSLIISQSERAWSFQWAKTLFALERRLNDEQRLFYLKKYAINLFSSIKSTDDELDELDDNSDSVEEAEVRDQFVPGLMIIKRTNCTRAEMRRKIIRHWQKSLKRVLEELKKGKHHD